MRKPWMVIAFCLSAACESAPTDARDKVGAAADLTTRQLIAALNAKSKDALAPLIVLTSTTGGPPRALRPRELDMIMIPEPPFEYEGAGKPGFMILRDGTKQKRAVHLIMQGDTLKVLATNEALSAYLERETGTKVPAADTSVRVLSIMRSSEW